MTLPAHPSPLAAAIAAGPHLADDAPARGKFKEWLAALDDTDVAAALQSVVQAYPKARTLMAGLAAYSPHLWDLATADAKRLAALLQAQPDAHFRALLQETASALAATQDEAEAMRLLRRMKSEAALLIGLADIGGVWPVMQVTQALTELADTAVSSAVNFLLRDAVRRGKLKPADPARPDIGSGYIVLAMGKMGAFELNYSSDIDLIVFFEPDAPTLAPDADAASIAIRVTRGLVKLLSERTADGYVFRVDLRLRPDPASTQIAISTPAALDYYEHRGQNWERSALIKARPCAGDIAAGEAILRELSPFVWRKYMDFAALADIHAMKRQIHAYKGHGEIAVAGHNIKLGRGGIREIEFFVQTQQLIAGGRHPELRQRRTLETLRELVAGKWVAESAADDLQAAYLFLREVEHRLQMVADEQTHILPDDAQELERFARFLGYATAKEFAERLLQHLHKVQEHYSHLFEQALPEGADQTFVFPKDADDPETLDRLASMGFRNPLEISSIIRTWFSGQYMALRSEFARTQLNELIPFLIAHLARSENKDAALLGFDRFLANLHGMGGGQLISLLRQNQDLLSLLMLILANAPRLAEILAQHPQVMDALIDPAFFGELPDDRKLTDTLYRSLNQSSSYEDMLDRLRIFGQEQMFLIGARILSGTVTAVQAGEVYARLADVIIGALHVAVENRFIETYGRIAGQKTALLALGKLGGREMTASSDLDLILLYDFDEAQPESQGGRPLYGAQYFARLTQRLISALTARTNHGALYEVDMRLRPSGRSGPVATKITAFKDYQENEAWTWEHMALTRARVVSATPGFREEAEAVIRGVLCRARDARTIADDAAEMRRAIAQEKGEGDRWDLKYAAGGLIDVEFIAQYLQLVHATDHPEILDQSTVRCLEKASRLGLLSPEDAEVLRPAAQLYQDLSQILRLCLSGPFDPKQAGTGLLRLLARAADVPDFATLDAYVLETQEKVRRSFLRILGQAG
jgi:glutamate-ammonia-ligase adenylyltransferase